jgi:hypothetical protein
MGCDIHSRVEVYRERYKMGGEDRGGRWMLLEDEVFTNSWYDPDATYPPFREQYTCKPLDDRNYTLFALLADVRNGRGFAGIRTGNPIIPLDQPRGVPSNASHGWMEEVESWDVDMHSHTWFTLRELLEPNPLYDQPLIRRGVISATQYEHIKSTGSKPTDWSGSITGPNIRTVTVDEYEAGERAEPYTQDQVDEMQRAWRGGRLSDTLTVEEIDQRLADHVAGGRTYVEYIWEDSLRESTGQLHSMIAELKRYADDLPPLGKLLHDGEPAGDEPGWYGHGGIPYDNLRVVAGFDN